MQVGGHDGSPVYAPQRIRDDELPFFAHQPLHSTCQTFRTPAGAKGQDHRFANSGLRRRVRHLVHQSQTQLGSRLSITPCQHNQHPYAEILVPDASSVGDARR